MFLTHNKNKKINGISLIILVVTIVVMLIILSIAILSLTRFNSIENAQKIKFLSDYRSFDNELKSYISLQESTNGAQYDPALLQADSTSVTYNGVVDTTKNITSIIPSITTGTDYTGNLAIVNGNLVYTGTDTKQKSWADVYAADPTLTGIVSEPTVTVTSSQYVKVDPGKEVLYLAAFESNNPITSVNLTGKVHVIDQTGANISVQPPITIGTVSGTSSDTKRDCIITVDTTSMIYGVYSLKIDSGAITDSLGSTNIASSTANYEFAVNTTSDTLPPVISLSTTAAAREVAVTVSSSQNGTTLQYSLDNNSTWNAYSSTFTLKENTTVYARAIRNNKISEIATNIISNIDNVSPVIEVTGPSVAYANSSSTVTYLVKYTDTNLSSPTLSLGDITVNKSGTVNANVAVTGSGSTRTVSLSSISGNGFMSISINAATAIDTVGNIASAVDSTNSFVVDTIAPTVAFETNGGTGIDVATKVDVVDNGSGINTSTLKYAWSSQNTTKPTSGWVTFTNGSIVSNPTPGQIIYLWVDGSDLAGNSVGNVVSNSFIADIIPPTPPAITLSNYSWTSSSITATIDYASDAVESLREYSLDGTNWILYTGPFDVSSNLTIYTSCYDASFNQSTSSLVVTNIDKTAPTVAFSPNGSGSIITASTNVTVTDTQSGVNTSTLYYYWDTQNTTQPTTGWTSFTNGAALTKGSVNGAYYLWIKGADNVGNSVPTLTVSNAFVIDNTAPTITTRTIASNNATNNAYATTGNTVVITLGASENISKPTVTIGGTAATVTGSGANYTATVTAATGMTEGALAINISGYSDTAGNAGASYTTTSNASSVTYDKTAPTIAISAPSATSAKTGNTVTYTVTYTDTNFNASTLATGNITLNKTGTATGTVATVTGTGNTRTVTINTLSGEGTIGITVAAGTATDLAGLTATASAASTTFTVDNTAPTMATRTIASNNGTNTAYATTGNTVTLSMTSNETITAPTVTIGGTAATVSGAGTSWTATVTAAVGMTEGALALNISGYTDTVGNTGTTYTTTTNSSSVTYDKTAPTTTVSAPSVAYANVLASVTYTVTYTDTNFNSSTLATGNVTLNKTGTANGTVASVTGTGNTRTVTINSLSGDGTVGITVAAGTATDLVGLTSTASAASSTIIVDNTGPTATIGTNGGTGVTLASTIVTVTDATSGVNASTTKYVWDTQNVTKPTIGWTTFTNGGTINYSGVVGTYYLWIDAYDNASNMIPNTVSNAFVFVPVVNDPVLATGMTAKKWNSGTSTWDTVASPSTDKTWFNYASTDKMWANAQTADGSMWVWVPRYIYKFTSGWHTNTAGNIAIQFTQGTNDNWNSSMIGIINPDTSANASNGTWTNHPAFTFGSIELTGIWVAKFEASGTPVAVDVKPGVVSLSSISMDNLFTAARNMETNTRFGWGTTGIGIDTHLIKNTEWGAVAYLAQSVYGINSEIATNSNASGYTGGGSGTAYQTNVAQSTTGNIYGIYDMSGLYREFTAAYINNSNSSFKTYGLSIFSAGNKYKDIYSVGATDQDFNNYSAAISEKGDAIYETSSSPYNYNSWYTDASQMSSSSQPFFLRGGYYGDSTAAGAYSFYPMQGYGAYIGGFRPALAVSSSITDKTAPTVVFGTNGSGLVNLVTASTTVTFSDAGSGIDSTSFNYTWSNQNSLTPITGWTSFTNGATITKTGLGGAQYLWVRGEDIQGNCLVTASNVFYFQAPANAPDLATGMTAKKWNTGTSTWDTVTDPVNDTSWYNYDTSNKVWANAQTADGSMWVWIPRYIYNINASSWNTSTPGTISIQFSYLTDDNWNSTFIGNINTDSAATASKGTWTNHPAFTFGSTELDGIWVAKFEASGTLTTVDSKPGVASMNNYQSYEFFQAFRNMETTNGTRYGWGTGGAGIDTHMIKNTEWGAVAYLTQSVYGRNGTEVSANTDITHYTGGGSGTAYQTNVTQSTTGNINGIYDMSGNRKDYTAAYIQPLSGYSISTYNLLITAGNKYKDVYSAGYTDSSTANYNSAITKKGDAVFETSGGGTGNVGWFSDTSLTPYSATYRTFSRGGQYDDTTAAGLFNFYASTGGAGASYGSRPVLAVSSSLTDDVNPTVSYGTNGASNVTVASSNVTVNDSSSGINIKTIEFVWDSQNTSVPLAGWMTFKNGEALTKTNSVGTYYLWIRGEDLQGNSVVATSNAFTMISAETANAPVLATGMTAKKWNQSTSTWDSVTNPSYDTSWYSYDTANKMWANAQTADGSMWVWIPRYIYKITSGWNTATAGTIAVQFSKGTNDNWNSANIGTIVTGAGASTSNNTWTNHPAFTFGSSELTGIWVAKFEATAREGVANTTVGDDVTTKNVKILPGSVAWRYISIDRAYLATRKMENDSTFGWGTSGTGIDTHLIKNTEWGALAYLAHSAYGRNGTEITINADASFYTGGGTGTSYLTNIVQSTTGNAYGVYDTVGGAWDMVAAYVDNANAALTTNAPTLYSTAGSQYKNAYTVGASNDYATNFAQTANTKGDAEYETASLSPGSYAWFGDLSWSPYGAYPFILRGASNTTGATAGIFSFDNNPGVASAYFGFRPVLAVATPPSDVSIKLSNTGWTNSRVTAEINYPSDANTYQRYFSLDGASYFIYYNPILLGANGTVYAYYINSFGDASAYKTLDVFNIDTTAPTITFGTNGSQGVADGSTTVLVSDLNGSGIRPYTTQYYWDTQNVTAPTSGWTLFNSGDTITKTGLTGNHYLWIQTTDNAGNVSTSVSNVFSNWAGVNRPILLPGMTAKKWNSGTSTWDTVSSPTTDTTWYNYDTTNKIWANAQTTDGSMWVWVPRFVYKIATNWHTATAGTVNVTFSNGTDDTVGGTVTLVNNGVAADSNNTWTSHPAFTFGTEQLTGVWVAKFEASGTTAAVDSKPGVAALTNQIIGNFSTACQNMETTSRYGWGTTAASNNITAHMMKNTEWGAIAMLAQSSYGKNGTEVSINSSTSYYTGGGTGTAYYATNTAQSTTGNVNGIYDMNGGAYEYVAGYLNNGTANLATNGSSLVALATKYKDLYSIGTTDTAANNYVKAASYKGDAVYETSSTSAGTTSWFTDQSAEVVTTTPFFVRGGYCSGTTSSGLYAYTASSGAAATTHSFRPVLASTDETAPAKPAIVLGTSVWTKGPITINVYYSSDTVTKQYSTNGTTWNSYTSPFAIATNNTTVYAKATDAVGNVTTTTCLVSNIDSTGPDAYFYPNGLSNVVDAGVAVYVTDTQTGLDTTWLQYAWDTQNVTAPGSYQAFTNGGVISRTGLNTTMYLWIQAKDKLGTLKNTVSNAFIPLQLANKTYSGATTGFAYNNPVIPAGFTALTTTAASWTNLATDYNNGLVIQDANGNQFVWVPVDGTNVTYAKWNSTGNSYAIETDDTFPEGLTESAQVTKYGGFYVGRYESSFDYNGGAMRAAVKVSANKATADWSATRTSTYNGYLWNWLVYSEAKSYSENMANAYGYDKTKVITNLITGTQWDTTLKWMQNAGFNASVSNAWGNFSDSVSPANITGFGVVQISGFSEYWKAKNIYDFAGNDWEWTNAHYNNYTSIFNRSGNAYNPGATYGAGYRGLTAATTKNAISGFRVCLFVK